MEALSVFDIFKIGVGPSSSHTMGPWRAAEYFLKDLEGKLAKVGRVQVFLYGSLAKTGKGHGTDVAVLLGLSGEDPVSIDTSLINEKIDFIKDTKQIKLQGKQGIPFEYDKDLIFTYQESLPYHPNGLRFKAYFENGQTYETNYYSVGGGFVEKEGAIINTIIEQQPPYPIANGQDLLKYTQAVKGNISDIVWANEQFWRKNRATYNGLWDIWQTMRDCMYRGCHAKGILPGGLEVSRRACQINEKLLEKTNYTKASEWIDCIKTCTQSFQKVLKWVSCFALAVNEENAAFGRVVTAPTNGAAGVVPAVLMYYVCFCDKVRDKDIIRFLLTASEIGSIFKKGATISAAMGGCQAEIGVSSAMAAAALTERLGGTPEQSLMASEIAMEHHLGLTCDPIGGLVQIPCIERNSMGAIKAITAANIALESEPSTAKVSLDGVVKTMWETAQDMNTKYKETAEGGLAINVPISVIEC